MVVRQRFALKGFPDSLSVRIVLIADMLTGEHAEYAKEGFFGW